MGYIISGTLPATILFSTRLQKASSYQESAAPISGLQLLNHGVGLCPVGPGSNPCRLGHPDRILGSQSSTHMNALIHLSQCSVNIEPLSKCAPSTNVARPHKAIRSAVLPACAFPFMLGPTPWTTQLPWSNKQTSSCQAPRCSHMGN